jgi:uncharacterized membrane protein YhaH (DUF805 family)
MPRLFSFAGTSDRFEWWWVSIFGDLLLQLALLATLALLSHNEGPVWIGIAALAAVQVTGLWLALAVTVRRLRERERSPWLLAAALVPFVGWLWLMIECGFLPAAGKPRRRTLVTRTVTAAAPLSLHDDAD